MKENISSESIHPSATLRTSTWALPGVPILLAFWLSVAVLLTLTLHFAALGRPFDYANSSGDALYSTIARSFVEHGVVALGGLPIRNNPPLGSEPDAYIHWPPLFPMLLSVAFRVFGEAESVGHGLVLVILLANALALYALVNSSYGSRAAVFSVFAFLVMPVTAKFGHLINSAQMGILFMLLAVLGFIKATATESIHRGWAALGAAAQAVAVLSVWQPLLASLGLLAVALWRRRKSQIYLASLYLGVGLGALISVLGLYLFNAPHLASDLWHTLLFRMGMASFESTEFRIHALVHDAMYALREDPTWIRRIGVFIRRFSLEQIGPLATVAVGGVLLTGWLRRPKVSDGRSMLLFGGLIAPWLIWLIIMPDHVYFHEIEMVFAAPMAAVAVGISVAMLIGLTDDTTPENPLSALRWVALIVLPMVMLLPLSWELKKRLDNPGPASWMIAYARDINQNTESEAIVLVPYIAAEAVYYSRRHMIQGVANDAILDNVVQRSGDLFPGSPVYLALSPDLPHERFSLRRYEVVKQTAHLILLAVPATATGKGRSSVLANNDSRASPS